MTTVHKGLPSTATKRMKVLILGTFPSCKSLEIQQYYANPSNQFWKLIAAVINEELDAMSYKKRIELLARHGVVLWDVYASCERDGSSDAKIKRPEINNFKQLISSSPNLTVICCNGKKAHKVVQNLFTIPVVALPSSSRANARTSIAEKTQVWSRAIGPHLDKLS